jgi:hypothetical protein
MGDMDSFVTHKQFIMMHVMNNFNKDKDKTAKKLKKFINDKKDHLAMKQMHKDLSLQHEHLDITEDAEEFDSGNDGKHALFAGAGRWKCKCNKWRKQGTELFIAAPREEDLKKVLEAVAAVGRRLKE